MEVTDYQDISIKLAPLLDALSHPARLQIVLHLAKYYDCPAGSISERLPLSKSTVSQHLNTLKEAGLITSSPDGACQRYRLNGETLGLLDLLFAQFRAITQELSQNREDCPGGEGCRKEIFLFADQTIFFAGC